MSTRSRGRSAGGYEEECALAERGVLLYKEIGNMRGVGDIVKRSPKTVGSWLKNHECGRPLVQRKRYAQIGLAGFDEALEKNPYASLTALVKALRCGVGRVRRELGARGIPVVYYRRAGYLGDKRETEEKPAGHRKRERARKKAEAKAKEAINDAKLREIDEARSLAIQESKFRALEDDGLTQPQKRAKLDKLGVPRFNDWF